uniref:(northern house mosquito) hypothetical protein n=1 Tax=Culex pipiens TaxID=7175 RepID=A0A8D8NE21_CULPI
MLSCGVDLHYRYPDPRHQKLRQVLLLPGHLPVHYHLHPADPIGNPAGRMGRHQVLLHPAVGQTANRPGVVRGRHAVLLLADDLLRRTDRVLVLQRLPQQHLPSRRNHHLAGHFHFNDRRLHRVRGDR